MGWRDAGSVAWLQFISVNQCFTQLLQSLNNWETSRYCITDVCGDVTRLRTISITVKLHLCREVWTAVFDFQWFQSGNLELSVLQMALQIQS